MVRRRVQQWPDCREWIHAAVASLAPHVRVYRLLQADKDAAAEGTYEWVGAGPAASALLVPSLHPSPWNAAHPVVWGRGSSHCFCNRSAVDSLGTHQMWELYRRWQTLATKNKSNCWTRTRDFFCIDERVNKPCQFQFRRDCRARWGQKQCDFVWNRVQGRLFQRSLLHLVECRRRGKREPVQTGTLKRG